MRLSLACLCYILPVALAAQGSYSYSWEPHRELSMLSTTEMKLPEIILSDHLEYAYAFENDNFIMYNVVHRIVRVNSSEAVERHNRIRIPMAETLELVDIKARSINANNRVVSFDKSNLKTIEDETNEGAQIFAIEGAEVGSEIEYYFIRKMLPKLFSDVRFEMDVPIKNASFTLRCPSHLKFDFKSYNGLPEVTVSESETENQYMVVAEDLAPFSEEEYSFPNAQKARLEYKLAYNTAKSRARMYTWDDAGKVFYARLHTADKAELKSLEKFLKVLPNTSNQSPSQKIRSVERFIKTTIHLDDLRSDESLSNINSIVDKGIASKFGMTRLFLQTFKALNIAVQPVMTCSREFAHFDESFDTWGYLDDYFLYFPATKGFLAPYNLSLSYPLADAEYTGQHGLFIDEVEIGSLKTGLTSIDKIPAAPYTLNTDDLEILVNFSRELDGNDITLKRDFKGYYASYFVNYYDLLSNQEKLALVNDMITQTAPGVNIRRWEASPVFDREVDEFIVSADFVTSYFVERAGPRILFKIGLLIGPQSELYDKSERANPVENDFNRGYNRTIKVTIPDGYAVRNPEDLVFNVTYRDGENIPFSFVSKYSLEGAVLTLTINEYYKELYAPLDRYNDYRAVINSAADFNKVVLVLEKRK